MYSLVISLSVVSSVLISWPLCDPILSSIPHIYIKATDRNIFISLPEKLCLLTIKVTSNYLMDCSTYTKRAALITCPLFLNIQLCVRV